MAYVSDEALAVVMPIVAYWSAAAFFDLLAYLRPDARLHSKEEEEAKNLPSRWRVAQYILFEQAVQLVLVGLYVRAQGDKGGPRPQPPIPVLAMQMLVGMVILDSVQYFGHRFTHTNKFLYRHCHILHHTLIVPYPSGGLYSHPFDAVFLDIIGGILGAGVPGMTPRTATYFLCFANIRTVEVHCGLWLPWSPSHLLFPGNNPAFHETHHQPTGHRYNFSQPFFLIWDKILGTYMPYEVEKRKGGGYHVRMLKD